MGLMERRTMWRRKRKRRRRRGGGGGGETYETHLKRLHGGYLIDFFKPMGIRVGITALIAARAVAPSYFFVNCLYCTYIPS